jgi:hypothetical protein
LYAKEDRLYTILARKTRELLRVQGSGFRKRQTAESRKQGEALRDRALSPEAVHCFLLSAFL